MTEDNRERNPYIGFFLYLERYGLIEALQRGDLSFAQISSIADHTGVDFHTAWVLACHSVRQEAK